MSKNLSFENSMKEDKNEEFLAFLKDYNALEQNEYSYNQDKVMVFMALFLAFCIEVFFYYQLKDDISKNMIMFGILFMTVSCFFKAMLNIGSGIFNRKQRKKDLEVSKEKAQGWIEFYKQKDNRLNLARSLIIRLDNVEKIKFETLNKENIDKSIQLKKEDIYNFVNYEISENDFDSIDSLLIKIQNIENNTLNLFKQEQELKQIKNEIHAGITSNHSNSFKNEKKKTSFN